MFMVQTLCHVCSLCTPQTTDMVALYYTSQILSVLSPWTSDYIPLLPITYIHYKKVSHSQTHCEVALSSLYITVLVFDYQIFGLFIRL